MLDFWRKLNENPVYIREMLFFGRKQRKNYEVTAYGVMYLVLMLVPISSLLIFNHFNFFSLCNSPLKPEDFRGIFAGMLFLQCVCFFLLGLNSHNLFTREREAKTFDNLISTVIRSEDTVMGKFWAVFRLPATILTIYLPVIMFIGLMVKISIPGLILFYLFSMVLCALSSMLGLYFSITSHNTKEAGKKCVMVPVYMFLLPLLAVFVNLFARSVTSGFILSLLQNTGTGLLIIFDPLISLVELFKQVSSGGMLFPGLDPHYSFLPITSLIVYAAATIILYRKTVAKAGEVPDGCSGRSIRKEKSYRKPDEGEKREDWLDGLLKKLLPRSFLRFMDNPLYIRDTAIVNRSYENYSTMKNSADRMKSITYIAVVLLIVIIGVSYGTGRLVSLRNISFRLALVGFLIMIASEFRNTANMMQFEETTGGYDTLISSLLTPEEILQGKFWIFLYPAIKKVLLFSPLIIIGGVLSGFSIPGILSLVILLFAYMVMANLTMLYYGIPDTSYESDTLKDIYSTAVLMFCGGLALSAHLVDLAYQYLGFIPIKESEVFEDIFPISQLWIKYSRGFTDRLDPVMLSATVLFLAIFLCMFAIFFRYVYKKALKKLGEVPQI